MCGAADAFTLGRGGGLGSDVVEAPGLVSTALSAGAVAGEVGAVALAMPSCLALLVTGKKKFRMVVLLAGALRTRLLVVSPSRLARAGDSEPLVWLWLESTEAALPVSVFLRAGLVLTRFRTRFLG